VLIAGGRGEGRFDHVRRSIVQIGLQGRL